MGRDAGFELRLSGGWRQTLGDANAVASEVAADPALAAELWEAAGSADDVVAGRAVDALAKASRTRPEVLDGHEAEAALSAALDNASPAVRARARQLTRR